MREAADWTTPRSDIRRSRSALLGGRPAQEAVMKRSLTRRVPLFVTILTAALIVVGWRVASAGACIRDGQTCRTNQSCCSGACVKSSKKFFGTCCTPTTCAAVGANCGMIADGCGGTLNCGTCTLPQTCGGGVTPNVWGSTTATTTTTSAFTTPPTLSHACGDGIRHVVGPCDRRPY